MDDAKTLTLLSEINVLEQDSRIMAWAFYHEPTDQFLILPEADYGSREFEAAQTDANKRGAKLVAVVGWMKDPGPEGEARFGYAVMPDGSDAIAQRARDLFRKTVVEAGLQTGELTFKDTGHS